MKTLILALSLMLLVSTRSLAGPNEGAALTPHGNILGVETDGTRCEAIEIPATCEMTNPNALPDATDVEWYVVLAVREPDPLEIFTVVFGVGPYDPANCEIAAWGPCFANFVSVEIPSPAPPVA